MNYQQPKAVRERIEDAYHEQFAQPSGAIGLSTGQSPAPKEPTLQGRAEELMNYISRLGANQSLLREKLFGEGEQKCVNGNPTCSSGLESLLAMACQSAANLVGESESILKRL